MQTFVRMENQHPDVARRLILDALARPVHASVLKCSAQTSRWSASRRWSRKDASSVLALWQGGLPRFAIVSSAGMKMVAVE